MENNLKDKLGVKIVRRNKNSENTVEEVLTLEEYTTLVRNGLHGIIDDVEAILYYLTGNIERFDWDDMTFDSFNKIRHKILDKAGSIHRLPDEIFWLDE